MARMHTRRHGKSKSRKPLESEMKAEMEKGKLEGIIAGYVKQGMNSTLIGQKLKEDHGVGYARPILGKRLSAYMDEKGFNREIPTDLLNLMRKAVNMRKHLTANHRDVHGAIRLQRVESKIWRLGKYYRDSGKLPLNWKYNPEQAALIIKET